MADAALSAEELCALAEVLGEDDADDGPASGRGDASRDADGAEVDADVLSAILCEDAPHEGRRGGDAGAESGSGAVGREGAGSEGAREGEGVSAGECDDGVARSASDSEASATGGCTRARAGWDGGDSGLRVLRADGRLRHTGGREGGFLHVDELGWMREVLKRGGGGASSFDASHSLLVVGQSSGAILIADRETREVVQTLAPPRLNAAGKASGAVGAPAAVCVKLCPLGQYVVAAYWSSSGEGGGGGGSSDVRIYDWRRNSLLKSVPHRHLAPVSKLEFIGNTRFLSADTDGEFGVWVSKFRVRGSGFKV